jgi:PLP dependent protein
MNDSELAGTLADRLTAVRRRIAAACDRAGRPADAVTLVAVTKRVSVRVARGLFDLGVRDFGENRPQELWTKHAALPEANWHLIGHLQRNKLEKTIPRTTLVHSVDSERLLTAMDEFGIRRGRPVPILLELNCSREAAKGGFSPETAEAIVTRAKSLPGVRLDGLMTMAAYADDPELARPAFRELNRLAAGLPVRSMGMSNDFEVAIEEGATHIRIGTTLFDGLDGD